MIFRVDIQGAQTVRRVFPDAVTLFLVWPLLLYVECHKAKSSRCMNGKSLHGVMIATSVHMLELLHAIEMRVSIIC